MEMKDWPDVYLFNKIS